MGIALRVAEQTSMFRRTLRRFTYGEMDGIACPARSREYKIGHDASADIDTIDCVETENGIHADDWPHDDSRWPKKCEACDYEFTDADRWQRNDNRIYQLSDGTEFVFWGNFGMCAPPGTMIRAPWYDNFDPHPDGVEAWLVSLPDGGEWATNQRSTSGGFWQVTGTPPNIDVNPSIFHRPPHGWHGFIRNGELVDANG